MGYQAFPRTRLSWVRFPYYRITMRLNALKKVCVSRKQRTKGQYASGIFQSSVFMMLPYFFILFVAGSQTPVIIKM